MTPLGWILLALAAFMLLVPLLAIGKRRTVIANFERTFVTRRPVGEDGIVIGATTITLDASATHAVLLLHGFGDTPQSVRPLALALHAAGWSVEALLLPGHGRPLREYAATRKADWIDGVATAYAKLRTQFDVVVVCGISMGAALSVLLADRHPEIPALALLAPYLVMPRDTHRKTELAKLFHYVLPYHANTGGEKSIHDPVAPRRNAGNGRGDGAAARRTTIADTGCPASLTRVARTHIVSAVARRQSHQCCRRSRSIFAHRKPRKTTALADWLAGTSSPWITARMRWRAR